MKKLFKIVAILGILVVSASVGYYFFVKLPEQNQQMINAIKSTDDDVQNMQYDIDHMKSTLDNTDSNVSDIHDAMNL